METTKHINAPEPTGWISISVATYLANREWQINNLYGHGLHLSSPLNWIPRPFPEGIIYVKPIWIIWSNHRLHLLSQYLCDIGSYSQTLDSGKKNKTENMGWPSNGIFTNCKLWLPAKSLQNQTKWCLNMLHASTNSNIRCHNKVGIFGRNLLTKLLLKLDLAGVKMLGAFCVACWNQPTSWVGVISDCIKIGYPKNPWEIIEFIY